MAQNKFEATAQEMLKDIERILEEWYPDGTLKGRRFWIGDPQNGDGSSCNVDLESGKWYDFASAEGGGDLISLFAHKEGLSMGEARKILKEKYGPFDPVIVKPPKQALVKGPGKLLNGMDRHWAYKDADGTILCYVARKDKPDGAKTFRQVSYDDRSKDWIAKGYPAPRPLYNLDKLAQNPEAKVLVVEGEGCVDAAESVLGDRAVVTTWMGGASGVGATNWGPLSGRDVTIWPDADENGVGQKAALKIANTLKDAGGLVKLIDVSDVGQDKWDIADAVKQGWNLKKIQSWVRDHVNEFTGKETKIVQTGNIQNNILNIAPDNTALTDAGGLVGLWMQLGLQLIGQANKPAANVYNVFKILESRTLGIPEMWYDTFEQAPCIRYPGKEPQRVVDGDVIVILRQLQGYLGMPDVKKTTIWEYIEGLEATNRKNWAKDWITGLDWDGTERIRGFFRDICGAADDEYTQCASMNWWVSLAARITRPGCQVDTMPILEGDQGRGKSRLLRIIGGRLHSEIAEGKFDEKEIIRSMNGKAIIEFGELHAMKKADVTQLKAFLTRTSDNTRGLYARMHKDVPRHCVFVGTTNQDEYLIDETGNRRFWPIATDRIDDEAAYENREQYFAEAYHWVQKGHRWWDMPEDETVEAQCNRMKEDAFIDTIKENIMTLGATFRMSEILIKMEIPTERWDFGIQHRVGSALRQLGYRNEIIKMDGKATRYWTNKDGKGQQLLGKYDDLF